MARVLKQRIPDTNISMLIQRYTAELVEGHRDIENVICYDENDHPVSFFKLMSILRNQKFNIVFHTHPRFRLALITWFAGIPIRVGTGYRWYSFLFNRKVYEHRKHVVHHELEYNLHLLNEIGCAADGLDVTPSIDVPDDITKRVDKILKNKGVNETDKFIILHPGSGGSARNWSTQNFSELGKRLTQLPDLKIIITGGKGEQSLVESVTAIIGEEAISLVNMLTLRELCALAKRSSLFIANSTGPIHIAAAVGTPVVGFYSQIPVMSSKRWGPYTQRKTIFTPKDKPIDCKKCVGAKDGSCECMDSISVDEVYQTAVKMLMSDSKN